MAKKRTTIKRLIKKTLPKKTQKSVKPKKKHQRKKRIGREFTFAITILISIILVISFFVFYTLFIFPNTLNKKVKSELIAIYGPLIYDDSKNMLILKLDEKPPYEIQKNAFNIIKEKHGLEMKFKKINSSDGKGINKIEFFRNEKEFNELKPVYIYWDRKLLEEEIVELPTEKKEEKISYEKIEEKRKNEKQEKLSKPSSETFKHAKPKEQSIIIEKPKIAIVIDDVGYSYNSTYDFLTLGFPVTFALIPDLQDTDKFYKLFMDYGYELILHVPMEPLKGKKYVENNAIFADMNDNEVKKQINYFLNKYPEAIGANNHMGSKIVKDARIMNVVINELSMKDKLWLDSMTNKETVTKEVASVHNLKYFERDIFLDNKKDINEIRKAMDKLIKEAKEKGHAIGIGHIQTRELVNVLKEYYDKKEELGVEFVGLKNLH